MWGFEEANGWTATAATAVLDTTIKDEGTSSLLVTSTTAGTSVTLTSRPFSTTEAGSAATTKIGLDVWLPQAATDSEFISLQIECASAALYGYYVDNLPLKSAVTAGGWARVDWTIKAQAVQVFNGDYKDCFFTIKFDGAPATFRLDGLAFDN